MPVEITMPRLSDTMERGTIVSWNVKEGDKVAPGKVLGDIETDKATMELQSFDTGTVAAMLIPVGQPAEVGRLILVLAEEGEDAAAVKAKYAGSAGGAAASGTSGGPALAGGRAGSAVQQSPLGGRSGAAAPPVPTASTAILEPPSNAATPMIEPPTVSSGAERVFVSPLARKIAEERGIDLNSVQGTGPGGRITRRDVEAAGSGQALAAGGPALPAGWVPAESSTEVKRATRDPARSAGPPSHAPVAATVPGPVFTGSDLAPLPERAVTLSNMRATIARRLVQSKTTIPHYQVTVTAAMDRLLALREQLNDQLASQGVKLSVNDFLVRACALAMHEHPFINASWGEDGQSIALHGRVNIGVAIALPVKEDLSGGGLVVATLRDADRMGLRAISSETKRLADKARAKGLTIDEMADATFTISNLGMYGVEHFTAIINPPNSAILAVGAAIEKPVVRRNAAGASEVVAGHEMSMTMSSDHRVIDGAMAARFLQTVRTLLEAPAALLV